MTEKTTTTPAYRPVYADPVATNEPEQILKDMYEESYIQPAEDVAAWDISLGLRIGFDDDQEFEDGRGLHFYASVGPDFPAGGIQIRTVTPDQIRRHAEHMLMLARRAEDRRKTNG